jgi:hypothetical protein
VRSTRTGEHGHFSGVIHADCVITGGEGIDAVEMIAFHPVLKLTGLIAGVSAYFEHGNDDNLHRDGMGFGLRESSEVARNQERKNDAAAGSH